jgi:hypothetical protein
MTDIGLKKIYVDPSSRAYYKNQLFDLDNLELNREDTLASFIRLRKSLKKQGIDLHTADYLFGETSPSQDCDYYSLGVTENYKNLALRNNVRMKAFAIFEPPVVDPHLYKALPSLTANFERVYVHNTEGDGYSLMGVDQSKLRKLFWPQPYKDVPLNFWGHKDRLNRIVMINGNHKPVSYKGELYSKRIEALVSLSAFGNIDLFGHGWGKWWMRSAMWLPYWKHKKVLMSIYKGACKSKYEVLCRYKFAICFENMEMKGYITEKIFDCFYAGVIPIYLGASDIEDLIPSESYIDIRKFSSWEALYSKINSMTEDEINVVRMAGRSFVQGPEGMKYYNGLLHIFNEA